jgi:Rrf2 family transcriptional regulator, nitric oxide-sensitive transcriptional repressor
VISQSAEYSLRAVCCLASQSHMPLTTQHIAEIAKIPAGYLSKILQALGKAGLVNSQRGIHGGFVLAKDPAELTVLQVLQSVEHVQRIHACPLGLPQHSEGELCALHRHLDAAMAAVEKSFAECTIAQLMSDACKRPMACGCNGNGKVAGKAR